MAARTTRPAARERVQAVFGAALDRLIPPDEAVPMKGSLFVDFEDQVEALVRAVAPPALEERAAGVEDHRRRRRPHPMDLRRRRHRHRRPSGRMGQ